MSVEFDPYLLASSRPDVSQWVVHLSAGTLTLRPYDVVRSIVGSGRVLASRRPEITRFDARGASCFYDVPPALYQHLVHTNPNRRQPYGLVVSKGAFWKRGGRPAIYTDRDDPNEWPAAERYRLIRTELDRTPKPVDWTHEREWRVAGDLVLFDGVPDLAWWWPVVPSVAEACTLMSEFPFINAVYSMERGPIYRWPYP